MATFIPAAIRRAVIKRANRRCEYCHKPPISFVPHEIDHIIAQKHGGATALDNLAYTCFECNRYKGSDLSSLDPETNLITPLFNPRTQQWTDHFRFEEGNIVPLSLEGRTTVFLLRLNTPERILERRTLKVGTKVNAKQDYSRKRAASSVFVSGRNSRQRKRWNQGLRCPSNASAITSPNSGANLKPCPLPPAATVRPAISG